MARVPPPRSGRRGHALRMRVVATAVLIGYGLTLGSTSTGHGLRLLVHLAEEHHERLEALVSGADVETEHIKAHTHEIAEHSEVEHLASGFHSHDGHVHSHHETPPPLALVTITLDKHCLASRPAVPAPREGRAVEPATPFEAPAVVVHPVEVRPPERSA